MWWKRTLLTPAAASRRATAAAVSFGGTHAPKQTFTPQMRTRSGPTAKWPRRTTRRGPPGGIGSNGKTRAGSAGGVSEMAKGTIPAPLAGKASPSTPATAIATRSIVHLLSGGRRLRLPRPHPSSAPHSPTGARNACAPPLPTV